jgi:hypothetical protein
MEGADCPRGLGGLSARSSRTIRTVEFDLPQIASEPPVLHLEETEETVHREETVRT